MKKVIIIALLVSITLPIFAEKIKIKLPEGTAVTLVTHQRIKLTTRQTSIHLTVQGDVYDESGEYVVIENGAHAEGRIEGKRHLVDYFWGAGDPGRIRIIPTSCETITGRIVGFKEKWFTIEGKNVRAGTPFTVFTSKDMIIVIDE